MGLFSYQPPEPEDKEEGRVQFFYSEIRKVKPEWTDEECQNFLWGRTPFPFDTNENILKYVEKNLV